MPPTFQTALLTSSITAAVTILTFILAEPVKWFFRRYQERTLLRILISDLERHIARGIERIEEIVKRSKDEKPAALHISKLKIDEKNPIFSDDNLRYLGSFDAARVATLRLRLRNFNLDCQYLEIIYKTGHKDYFIKALGFVLNRSHYLHHQVRQTLMHYPTRPPFRDEMLFFSAHNTVEWAKVPLQESE